MLHLGSSVLPKKYRSTPGLLRSPVHPIFRSRDLTKVQRFFKLYHRHVDKMPSSTSKSPYHIGLILELSISGQSCISGNRAEESAVDVADAADAVETCRRAEKHDQVLI
jgi:hypothetical protein